MKNLTFDQVALSNFPYYKYSLGYTLDSLQRLNAENIEFYAAYPHLCLSDATTADARAVGKQLRDHGLRVINFCPENCTYPINAASINPATRQRCVSEYVKAIQFASEWECPNALFFPGFALADENQEDAWKRAVDTMRYLAGAAEAYGVTLILESAGIGATVMNSSEKQVRMMREVGSPNVSCMVDLTCMHELGETIRQVVDTVGIRELRHVHFHNCQSTGFGRWEHRIPQDGVLDIRSIVDTLDEEGFTGHFGCEVFGPYAAEPEVAMQAFLNWFADIGLKKR